MTYDPTADRICFRTRGFTQILKDRVYSNIFDMQLVPIPGYAFSKVQNTSVKFVGLPSAVYVSFYYLVIFSNLLSDNIVKCNRDQTLSSEFLQERR
jgi:hypothetical protein